MTATLAEYRSHKELLSNLTLRELRGKYKRSFLGFAWSMITPLCFMVIYTIVFSLFLHEHPPKGYDNLNVFALWLLCAMLPYNYFQTSVMNCVISLVANGTLIKKTYFPRELLPTASVIGQLFFHTVEMALLVVALLAFGDWPALVYLPLAIALMVAMAVFSLGFGLAFSALNVYFRDIEHFMGILFLMWMFLTPIMYPITDLHGNEQLIIKLNPMTDATQSFRAILYNGTYPGWTEYFGFMVVAVVVFFLGRFIFNRLEPRFAEEL